MAFSPTHILSQSITPAASVLNLGVTFDENFTFKQHISKTWRCCFFTISGENESRDPSFLGCRPNGVEFASCQCY